MLDPGVQAAIPAPARVDVPGLRQRRLATQGLQDATGASVVGEAPSDTWVALVWTPAVVARGSLFARFELIDGTGTVLDSADSERFAGLID